MGQYRLTHAAEGDVQQILEYTLERWGPKQVGIYASKLDTCFEELGAFAALSKPWPGDPELRVTTCGRHYVFYLQGDPNVIVAVLHEKEDCVERVKHRLPPIGNE